MKHFFVIFSLLLSSALSGQVRLRDGEVLEAVAKTPGETVYVHYNSSLFFAGEYLYYKLYCLDLESKAFSDLSKVAYVELVGEQGVPVFQQKLVLDKGTGQGDFFIPPSVPSGNYKLLGYTQWMLNGEEEQLFAGDLVIINPYTNAQEALLEESQGEASNEKVSSLNSGGTNGQGLKTDAEMYGFREKAVVTIDALPEGGKYSLSVSKLEEVQLLTLPSSAEIAAQGSSVAQVGSSEGVFLPELRGELFTGSITPKQGSSASVTNRAVAISIPGENYILKLAATDEQGRFFFNVEDYNLDENAVLQVLGKDADNFIIELQQPKGIDYSSLEFKEFRLTPGMRQMISARSVYNQVENAYFEAKPDTLKLSPPKQPLYGKGMTVYDLDEYTRFKTIRETVVEIIKFVSIGKDAEGDDSIRVFPHGQSLGSSLPPLVIVDGVLLQEQGDLIHYPAERIKSIGIMRDKYYLGAGVFQGVVAVETMEGNFNEGRNNEYLHSLELLRPEPKKFYFRQYYSAEDRRSRIPDFRTQLLWEPQLQLSSGTEEVVFFTSDVPGTYEISLEGFTATGVPVSLRKQIRVQE